ncbi:MAG TPA: nuclear transport factor 2 family protein [Prolixibacteraceae bacterium]|jgi:preprotein translocase subunit YajC
MKKIHYLLLIFMIVSMAAFSQAKQEKEVAEAVESLKKGIVDADKGLLGAITADQLVYGHSNGKVQNKAEFIAEILNTQTMDYTAAGISDQTIHISGDAAIVRHIYSAETISNGTPGHLKIGVMLIWQKQHGKWKLLARQAYKV